MARSTLLALLGAVSLALAPVAAASAATATLDKGATGGEVSATAGDPIHGVDVKLGVSRAGDPIHGVDVKLGASRAGDPIHGVDVKLGAKCQPVGDTCVGGTTAYAWSNPKGTGANATAAGVNVGV